jgi:hypothetical protein
LLNMPGTFFFFGRVFTMKSIPSLLIGLTLAGLLAVTGCKTGEQGGPGADKGNPNPLSAPDDSFTLTVPTTATTIKQGESKNVTIGIKRGKNFDQDVKLSFSGAPSGAKIDPSQPVLKKSEKEVSLTVAASKDAALGRHTITVTGAPARSGREATNTFDIKITEP